ncbi:hypothetical protein N7445_003210 [Penicillium cf. griseofulvum]|nr:hypothetical protein N7445_003210 [Penicillium cf. griseofulvum]
MGYGYSDVAQKSACFESAARGRCYRCTQCLFGSTGHIFLLQNIETLHCDKHDMILALGVVLYPLVLMLRRAYHSSEFLQETQPDLDYQDSPIQDVRSLSRLASAHRILPCVRDTESILEFMTADSRGAEMLEKEQKERTGSRVDIPDGGGLRQNSRLSLVLVASY